MNTLIRAWANRGQIVEGIKNSIFKKEDIEEVAALRNEICRTCPNFDTKGDTCAVPGTQPCCTACGCCLKFKQRAMAAACPLDKWKAEMSAEEMRQLNDKTGFDLSA